MPDLWEVLIVACQLGLYLGVAGTLGASFALLTFRHAGKTEGLKRYLQLSAVIGLTALAANFVIRTANMSGSFASALDRLFLGILWQSGVGSGTRWQLAGFGALLLGSFVLGRAGVWRRLAAPLLLGGGLALLWSFSFSGHFAGESWLNKSALAMHVLAMSLWLGSFYPLLLLLKGPQAAHNLQLFSTAGVWIVGLLVICGIWMAVVLLPGLDDLFTTAYGRVLLGKLALLILLLVLAAANKWCWLPRIFTHPDGIRRSIQGEVFVGVLILLTTAVLANLVGPH